MGNEFRDAEEAFGQLKESYSEGKISQREFIDTLKQLRIRDDEGRFWMIGAQTGKWYYFNGEDWVQAKPPSLQDRKAICIHCGFENDLQAEVCVRCGSRPADDDEAVECPRCGTRLERRDALCPVCTPGAGRVTETGPFDIRPAQATAAVGSRSMVVRALHPMSFFWFSGVLGIFAGILFGLLVGVTSFLPGVVAGLPTFFREIQGKLLGAVVFTLTGALAGFVILGAAGFMGSVVFNGILSLVGGVKVDASIGGAAGERESGPGSETKPPLA